MADAVPPPADDATPAEAPEPMPRWAELDTLGEGFVATLLTVRVEGTVSAPPSGLTGSASPRCAHDSHRSNWTRRARQMQGWLACGGGVLCRQLCRRTTATETGNRCQHCRAARRSTATRFGRPPLGWPTWRRQTLSGPGRWRCSTRRAVSTTRTTGWNAHERSCRCVTCITGASGRRSARGSASTWY